MGFFFSKLWNAEPDDFDVVDSATGLTPRQKQAVKDTWALVKQDIKTNGVDLFIRLFTVHPEYQKMFRSFADVPFSQLSGNRRLLAHATSVMYAITSVVDNLDDPDCLVELLNKTAESHVPRNLTGEHFENLAMVILELLEEKLGAQFPLATKEAWEKTLNVMNTVIIATMDKERLGQ